MIRLNVEVPLSYKLTEPGFWPDGVTCRLWMTRNLYNKKFRQNKTFDEDTDQTDLSNDVLPRQNERRYDSTNHWHPYHSYKQQNSWHNHSSRSSDMKDFGSSNPGRYDNQADYYYSYRQGYEDSYEQYG